MNQRTNRHAPVLLCMSAVFIAALLCASCTSGMANHVQNTGSQLTATQSTNAPEAGQQPGFTTLLPPPSALAQPAAGPRTASYTEADLYRAGKDFDDSIPHAGVSAQGDSVVFAPAWQPGGGLDGLAFCIYSFPAQGFDRELELNYQFAEPPADWSTLWMGTADWAADTWRWSEADPSGKLDTLLSSESFSTDGTVLVVFACMAPSGSPTLDWVYMGPPQVSAAIQTFVHTGVAPLSITADASGSNPGMGAITKYEWDWDGDGTFDEDTGDTPVADHTYADVGNYTPTVRVTSSFGVTDTASTSETVDAPWVHTWGGSATDFLTDAAAAPDAIYACGGTESYGIGGRDTLLLKYDLEGNLVWARASGGSLNEQFNAVGVGADGSIYAVGRTDGVGDNDSDVLLQKWDSDGNLVWSKTWGRGELDEAYSLSLTPTALYFAGSDADLSVGGHGLQILVAKFTLDGDPVWIRDVGGDYDDSANGIQVVRPLFGDPEIHFAGYTTHPPDVPAAVYGRFDDNGDLQVLREWFAPDSSFGRGLLVTTYPESHIFLCGRTQRPSGGQEALLVEYQDSGNPLAKAWGSGDTSFTEAFDIAGTYDGIALACWTTSGPSYILHTDSTGATLGLKAYGNPDGNGAAFYGAVAFPGEGVVVCGIGSAAAGVGPEDAALDARLLTGTWEPLGFSAEALPGDSHTLVVTVSEINSGVVDDGGGGGDCIVVAQPLP